MATTSNDDYEYDGEYNTDSVSTTSTVLSSWSATATYHVEEIISERTITYEEGYAEPVYLVRWVGYPLHQCTWEPLEHLETTTLLDDWESKREQIGDDEFGQLVQNNFTEFENAVNKVEAARTLRQQKRAKKRQRLKSAAEEPPSDVQSFSSSDMPIKRGQREYRKKPETDSESDTPLMVKTRAGLRQNDASIDVRKMRSPHRPPPDALLSSSSDDGSGTGIQKRAKALDSARRNPPQTSMELIERPSRTNDGSASSEKTTVPTSQPASSSPKSLKKEPNEPAGKRQDEGPKPRKSGPSRCISLEQPIKPAPNRRRGSSQSAQQDAVDDATNTSTIRRGSKVAEDLITKVEGPPKPGGKAQMNELGQFMRKTALNPRPIKMLNEPKARSKMASRKEGNESLYKKMHWKRKAELRGRDEHTPDPSVLSFVGSHPGGIPRPSARINDNPYGRRDITALRPAQDEDSDDSDDPSAQQPAKAPEWGDDKVPVTCFDWRSNSCQYTAEQCKYLHHNTDKLSPWDGRVPPKYARPKITCPHWMKKKCYKTDDECSFAHWNTGWLAGNKGQQPTQIDPKLEPSSKPSSPHDLTCYYWLRTEQGCKKSDAECAYFHRNTGWLLHQNRRDVSQIDPTEQPRHSRRRSDTQCFSWKKNRMCRYGDKCRLGDKCRFQHYDSEIVVESPHSIGGSASKATPSYPDYSPPQSASLFEHPTNETPTILGVSPAPASLSCINFRAMTEIACGLDFADMFRDDKGNSILERRAFLIFHPEDHGKEVELITRWLLLYHVEVCNFWLDGSWDNFKQRIIGGGSGVIIAHSDYGNYSEIPDFGQVLRRKVRVWSVGLQYGIEYDPEISTIDPPLRYDRIEIFPRGGIIYITDNVFEERPVEALKIIELFFAKVERCRQVTGPLDPSKFVDDGCVLWRLATRPGLMESIWKQCVAHEKEIELQDPVQSARAKLYELLLRTEYVEQEHSLPTARPEDYFPVMSERPEFIPDYYQALKHSQEAANTWMVQMYAGFTVDHRRHYRQFFVVHTHAINAEWEETCQNLNEIITPEKCIQYFEQPAIGNRFDFYEWAFPYKAEANSS